MKEFFKPLQTKNALLALVGESPGVVTETIWALLREKPSVVFDHVCLMTTEVGRRIFQQEVLDSGAWQALSPDLPLPRFQLFPAEDGRVLEDLTCTADVERAGTDMLQWFRGFASEPGLGIVASISGGRKSMTTLLGMCMSLLGRPGDRLVHVHVPSPYDRKLRPLFLFPGGAKSHQTVDGECVDGNKVEVRLIDVPFVPMYEAYKRMWGTGPVGFQEMLGRIESSLDLSMGPVTLRKQKQELDTGKGSLRLSENQFEFLQRLWTGEYPQYWGEDQRVYAGQVRSKLRKQGWGEAAIEMIIPNLRKEPRTDAWPPSEIQIR